MELSKYLILDTDDGMFLKLKVVEGFRKSTLHKHFTIKDTWEPDPSGNDKLYFLPGSNVPRFKVREKYTCTITPEKATAFFVNEETLDGSTALFQHYKNVYPLTKAELNHFKDWAKHLHQTHLAPMLLSITENINIENICLTEACWLKFRNTRNFSSGYTSIADLLTTSSYNFKTKCSDSEYQIFAIPKNSILRTTPIIYSEKALLKILNEDNLIIDEEKYMELRAFGNTNEHDNLVLMMELMSNSNFEKSILYLLLLLKEFGRRMDAVSESEHVNFRSLLSYLDVDIKGMNHRQTYKRTEPITLDLITKRLQKHGRFTKENAFKISCAFAGEDVKSDTGIWVNGPTIRLDNITT